MEKADAFAAAKASCVMVRRLLDSCSRRCRVPFELLARLAFFGWSLWL